MINILSQDIANRIAAGEVVENYASVLKELLENAIDAGASNIIVSINGLDIRVDDDGMGISKEDLPLSVMRFATSKIKSDKDLSRIKTLGFRGEALPSIGAVSKMTIISKVKDSKFAYKININGGNVSDIEKTSYTNGTSILVSDLFFNTPARLKFLKSDQSEIKNMYDIFEKEALSYNNIHFKLFKDSKCIYDLLLKSQKERFLDIIPVKDISLLTDFEYSEDGLRFFGYLGDVSITRSSRDSQFVYVNGRFIQNSVLYKALSDLFVPFITKGRYPIFCLFLEIDQNDIDVNVHPRKLEVKFKDTSKIFSLIKSNTLKTVSFSKFSYDNYSVYSGEYKPSIKTLEYPQKDNHITNSSSVKNNNLWTGNISIPSVTDNIKVYQLFDKFLVTENKDKIQIIDQHAASEKILYERLYKQFSDGTIEKQSFLIPYSIDLAKKDFVKIEENIDILEKIGIDISILSDNSIGINTIPFLGGENVNVSEIIEDIISDSLESKNEYLEKVRLTIASVACHSAVRFGDPLNSLEMEQIILDLQKCKDPLSCPHGRPTSFEIPLSDLNKKFKRA